MRRGILILLPILTVWMPACGARTDVGSLASATGMSTSDAAVPIDGESVDSARGDASGSCPLTPPVRASPCYSTADCVYFPSNIEAVCSFIDGSTNCAWFTAATDPEETSCADWAVPGLNCGPGIEAECIQEDTGQCCTCHGYNADCGDC
jgi:hypothetical protein